MKQIVSIVVLLIVGLLAAAFISNISDIKQSPTEKQSLVPYVSDEYDFSFKYPSGYTLIENENAGTPPQSQLGIALIDTLALDNVPYNGEGPTSMTIDVYQNPDDLSASEWATHDTNWGTSLNDAPAPTAVAGVPAVMYRWDGLYAGKSVIVSRGGFAYVFAVTWITEDDQILKDFDMVLDATKFEN